jgi:hypothetical protein
MFFGPQKVLLTAGSSRAMLFAMSSDPAELKETFQAEYRARWEAVETFKARELAAMTEERAWRIIRLLRPFTTVTRDPSNGLGLVEQQAIFHRRKSS